MAHKLGSAFNLPHGISNALLIDDVIRFNSSEAPLRMGTFPKYSHPHTARRYAEIAEFLGLSGKDDSEKIEKFIVLIDDLKETVGIRKTIRDYVPDEQLYLAKLDQLTLQAFDDQCTGANPVYPLIEDIKQIYLDAYEGKY